MTTVTTEPATELVPTHGVNLEILTRPFPPEAIKQREGGGRRKLSYVEAHTVIRRLNEATGFNWSFSVLKETQEGDLLKAHVCLTIPGLGSREHVGVQKISANGGEDLHKGAISDGLKKAATLFGVGLELYGNDYEAAVEERKQNQERNEAAEVTRAMQAFGWAAHEHGFDVTADTDPNRLNRTKVLLLASEVMPRVKNPERWTAMQWHRAQQEIPDHAFDRDSRQSSYNPAEAAADDPDTAQEAS